MLVSKLENISKSYQRGNRHFDVFNEYNLSIEKQELVVLAGQSGSGKSTLLAIIGGYLKPDNGKVLFNGEDYSLISDKVLDHIHSEVIGYLPQSNVMISEFNILENIMLSSLVSGENDKEKEALEILDMLEISSLADKFPHELSGGELRRTAIARLFLSDPELYLMDEPSAGLDKEITAVVMKYLKNKVENGATVVVATHDDLVKEYSSRIVEICKK